MKKQSEQFIKICPKCASIDIHQDKNIGQQMGIFPTIFVCKQCGQRGNLFPEIPLSEVEEYQRQVQEMKAGPNTKK